MPDPSVPEFSFSGLKTAARLAWEAGADLNDLAASFRRTVVELLVSKTIFQCRAAGARSLVAAGGVTANRLLRDSLTEETGRLGLQLFIPDRDHAMDNALMVGRAAAAVRDFDPSASSSMSCNAFARWTGTSLHPLCCH
jgi:N6-L-threonylcarbamoyladenine synthase